MLKRRHILLTVAAALSVSAGSACAGDSFSRQTERSAAVGDGAPPVQTDGREESPRLYPIWIKGKVGFIDNMGKLVIPPKFGSEDLWKGGQFSDGMARINVSTSERPGFCCRFGYINAEGRVVAEPQYWEARDFSEGLAAVLMGDRWGYIDKEGRMALGPKWVSAQSFSEGLASVYEDGAGHGYIDRSGRMVIKLEGATGPGEFHDGMAQVVLAAKDGGYFNREGQFEFGYIDRSGRLAVPGPFEKAEDFSEGLAAVMVGGKMGFIDGARRFAIEPAYDSARSFSEGTAVVGVGGKYWFIDKSGKKVGDCPPQSCNFHEGLAAFESRGKWGYIDRSGRVVIKPRFRQAFDFSGGIAMVMLTDKKMGYIDKTGKYVWKPSE